MVVLLSVVAITLIILFLIFETLTFFSEDISAYIQAKTDELRAMTELINRAKQKGTEDGNS